MPPAQRYPWPETCASSGVVGVGHFHEMERRDHDVLNEFGEARIPEKTLSTGSVRRLTDTNRCPSSKSNPSASSSASDCEHRLLDLGNCEIPELPQFDMRHVTHFIRDYGGINNCRPLDGECFGQCRR